MNETQRTILFWTMVLVAVFLHFSFVNWNPTYAHILWFEASDRTKVPLYMFVGLVIPAALVGAAFFIWYGDSKKKKGKDDGSESEES